MAWGTQEQKGDALLLGVNAIAGILSTRIANNEEHKKQLINAKATKKGTIFFIGVKKRLYNC